MIPIQGTPEYVEVRDGAFMQDLQDAEGNSGSFDFDRGFDAGWREVIDRFQRGEWVLVEKRGEGYPPPEVVYRGDLYTYRLVD